MFRSKVLGCCINLLIILVLNFAPVSIISKSQKKIFELLTSVTYNFSSYKCVSKILLYRFEVLGCSESTIANSNLETIPEAPGYISIAWQPPTGLIT